MRLRDDDDIQRARLVYLGWPGTTLPIQLPYAQWVLFAVLTAVFVGAALLLAAPLVGPGWAVGSAITVAMWATYWLWHHVDPDRPSRKVIRTLLTDWRRATPVKAGRLPQLVGRHIRIKETL